MYTKQTMLCTEGNLSDGKYYPTVDAANNDVKSIN